MAEKQAFFTLFNGDITLVRSAYNPTSDAVWLASFLPNLKIKTVLDIGIGTGGVSICLHHHIPKINITGIDISDQMLKIAEQNFALNNIQPTLLQTDIMSWKTAKTFDLVVTNPPYFYGTPAKHNAHHNIDIVKWVDKSTSRVKPGGCFCIITDILLLSKIVSVLESKHFGNIQILPLFSTKNTAERVLIRAKQGVKTGTVLYKGLSINNDDILRSGLTIDTLLAKL